MATPSEKLADSLAALKNLQDQHVIAIRSEQLSRTHRERLLKNGFIREVIKGWYIPSQNQAAIILLHGYGGNRLGLLGHAEFLARRGSNWHPNDRLGQNYGLLRHARERWS